MSHDQETLPIPSCCNVQLLIPVSGSSCSSCSSYPPSPRCTQEKSCWKRSLALQTWGWIFPCYETASSQSKYIFRGTTELCKIWQESSLVSLSVSKSLLFYQENASINVALNSHWCPQEDFEKKFYLKTSLLMCHLQYASLTPGKFAWKQDCYCSDILVFLLFILTGRGMLTTLPSLHTQAPIRKKKLKKIKGSFKCNLTAVSAHVLEIPVLVAGKLTCQRKQML